MTQTGNSVSRRPMLQVAQCRKSQSYYRCCASLKTNLPNIIKENYYVYFVSISSHPELSPMEDIPDIVRKIGRQQNFNVYYRVCYTLLKRLQDLLCEAIEEILRIYRSGHSLAGHEALYEITNEIRISISHLSDQAANARANMENFYSTNEPTGEIDWWNCAALWD